MFKVYLNMMETRFLVEMIIFFIITIFFLSELLLFNA